MAPKNKVLIMMWHSLAWAFVAISLAGCSAFSSGFETEVIEPFDIQKYNHAILFTTAYGEQSYADIEELFEQSGIDTQRSSGEMVGALQEDAILLVFKREYGFIFPPAFFHKPFDPNFTAVNYWEMKMYNRHQLLAKSVYRRGIFGRPKLDGGMTQAHIDSFYSGTSPEKRPAPKGSVHEIEKIINSKRNVEKIK